MSRSVTPSSGTSVRCMAYKPRHSCASCVEGSCGSSLSYDGREDGWTSAAVADWRRHIQQERERQHLLVFCRRQARTQFLSSVARPLAMQIDLNNNILLSIRTFVLFLSVSSLCSSRRAFTETLGLNASPCTPQNARRGGTSTHWMLYGNMNATIRGWSPMLNRSHLPQNSQFSTLWPSLKAGFSLVSARESMLAHLFGTASCGIRGRE